MGEELTFPNFTEHFVLFVDFLGFSEAVTSWDEDRARKLVRLLDDIAKAQTSFFIEGHSQSDGSFKIKIIPEVTTFSDHVVASYASPFLVPMPSVLEVWWLDMILQEAQKIVCRLAMPALQIGLLVRGGLTLGKLYHQARVVVGEGMVDAYQLENKVAVYPRVVVSKRLYSKLPVDKRGRLKEDRDGILHLDYFSEMLRVVEKSGPDSKAEVSKWMQTSIEVIDANIKRLEERERWAEAAKWAWFRDQVTHAAKAG